MKKALIIILIAFTMLILTACDSDTVDEVVVGSFMPLPDQDYEYETDDSEEVGLNIELLGETIISAGQFWEDWWNIEGLFSSEHVQWLDWDEIPEHISERFGFGIAKILPSSGFKSLEDIRGSLLNYHTEDWVDRELAHGVAFIEYNNVLYINGTRAGFPRPNWETAEHELLDASVVNTTVQWGSWHREPYDSAYPWEVVYQFRFIDGKIGIIEVLSGDTFGSPLEIIRQE